MNTLNDCVASIAVANGLQTANIYLLAHKEIIHLLIFSWSSKFLSAFSGNAYNIRGLIVIIVSVLCTQLAAKYVYARLDQSSDIFILFTEKMQCT